MADPLVKVEMQLAPIPMLLWCPMCNKRHIDYGEYGQRPHHTHACQYCGVNWRPAIQNTIGVTYLPGALNEADPRDDVVREYLDGYEFRDEGFSRPLSTWEKALLEDFGNGLIVYIQEKETHA